MARARHPRLDLESFRPRPERRTCDWPGCQSSGDYRAPRSRDALRDFYWFCLDHVRAYNQAWDFFKGMGRAEIEAYLRDDVTWHRPTWTAGSQAGSAASNSRWSDPLEVFGGGGFRHRDPDARPPGISAKHAEMLAVLDLGFQVNMDDIKNRYKELAKANHPDLRGGDKAAEERLKLINEAYTYLRDSGIYS